MFKTEPRHYKDETINEQQEVRKAFMRMLREAVVSAPTQKLYKLSIIREYHVEFPSLRRSQDVAFNYRYYNHVSSLRLISYSGYNYRLVIQQAYKTPSDYMETIRQLYTDCQAMYKDWAIDFPEQQMCTFFFRTRLYTHLQKAVASGWDIAALLNDNLATTITEKAHPDRWYLRLARSFVLSHNYIALIIRDVTIY